MHAWPIVQTLCFLFFSFAKQLSVRFNKWAETTVLPFLTFGCNYCSCMTILWVNNWRGVLPLSIHLISFRCGFSFEVISLALIYPQKDFLNAKQSSLHLLDTLFIIHNNKVFHRIGTNSKKRQIFYPLNSKNWDS